MREQERLVREEGNHSLNTAELRQDQVERRIEVKVTAVKASRRASCLDLCNLPAASCRVDYCRSCESRAGKETGVSCSVQRAVCSVQYAVCSLQWNFIRDGHLCRYNLHSDSISECFLCYLLLSVSCHLYSYRVCSIFCRILCLVQITPHIAYFIHLVTSYHNLAKDSLAWPLSCLQYQCKVRVHVCTVRIRSSYNCVSLHVSCFGCFSEHNKLTRIYGSS